MSKKQKSSPQVVEQAEKIASGIKSPNQTKEQTKLVAQGIQKGIDIYRKQEKTKSRGRDKLRKKNLKASDETSNEEIDVQSGGMTAAVFIPWALLALSWGSMAVYLLV